MATAQKSAQKNAQTSRSKKGGILNKLKAMLPMKGTKKSAKKPAPVMTIAGKMAADFDDTVKIPKKNLNPKKSTLDDQDTDKAHAPGHRKMNLKAEFAEPTGGKAKVQESLQSWTAPGDRVKQSGTPQRRLDSNSRSNVSGSGGKRGAKSSRA